MQYFTQYGGARPYGVSLMLAGVNKGRTHLYTSDVAGGFFAYKANAIGENDEKIKEMLRKDYNGNMGVEEGLKFCLKIFKEVLGKNFDLERFEVAFIKTESENIERVYGEGLKKYSK